MRMRGTPIAMVAAAVLSGTFGLWTGHARANDPSDTSSANAADAAARADQAATGRLAPDGPEGDDGQRGAVTNLPIPRYVSLKAAEGNVRRGPSLNHRIDWVFKHRDMPLRVTAEYGHWRRVEDQDGAGGWVHYMLISGVRTVVFTEDQVKLHLNPEDNSPEMAVAQIGAIARLNECQIDWCQVSASGEKGWVRKTQVWGVDPKEVIK